MKRSEAQALGNGLYRLHWKNGTGTEASSFAAIGRDKAGHVWFAPANWVTVPCFAWCMVARVDVISAAPPPPRATKPVTGWGYIAPTGTLSKEMCWNAEAAEIQMCFAANRVNPTIDRNGSAVMSPVHNQLAAQEGWRVVPVRLVRCKS